MRTALGYLGQTAPAPDDLRNLSLVGQMLRQLRGRLLEVDAVIRRSPAAAREVGPELTLAWDRYGSLLSNYQRFRVLLGFGEEPGLSGIVVGGLALAGLVALIGTLLLTVGYLLNRALQAERNERALSSAVASQAGAQSAGGFQTVISPGGLPVIFPSSATGDFQGWLEQNWIWLALVGGGVVLIVWLRR